jgi:hypothetical protein
MSSANKAALMDAVDQMFAEFELVYHNQYNKAFPNEEKLGYAKKLWFSNLADLQPQQILNATHRAIRESEFLPTIKGILKYCDDGLGLPDAHQAYVEACQASTPKQKFNWSHPAVYFAGQQTDWYFIASNPEQKVFPIFKRNYELQCQRVINGESLTLPAPKALPKETVTPLSNEQRKQRMVELRKTLNI